MALGLKCTCPKCEKGKIFAAPLSFSPKEKCENCGLAFKEHDIGDSASVFLIFILGFLIVPVALLADAYFEIPLWLHFFLWTGLSLLLCLGSLKPLKAYIIGLQYKHLPNSFSEEKDN
jgi:uncharacterized protein (DUF983 family)